MNADRLLEHFERISDAADAVPRIRRFVLDLAVRGKLLPSSSVSAPMTSVESIACDEPFPIPRSWRWVPLAAICSKTGSGSTPRGGKNAYKPSGIPFLRSQNVYDEGLRLDDVAYIDNATHEKMAGTAVYPGDLLLNITGGSMGRCARVPDNYRNANVSQHVAIIRVRDPGTQDYLHKCILSPFFQALVFGEQTGAGRGGLPKNKMDRLPIPLPPLAEQHRIVATVDELMALCDRLEAAQAEREARRDRLVSASLARVTEADSNDSTSAPTSARFHLDHFARLTTRPEHIKQLRQTILNLAVRGRLVPQDPKGESATHFLHCVAEAKAVGRKSRTLEHAASGTSNGPYPVPPGWAWTTFGSLIIDSDSGWSPKTEGFPRTGDNWGVLKVSAVSWDTFLPDENKQLLPGVSPPERAVVHSGDFLISRANTSELIAKCVVVEQCPARLIMSDKIVRLAIVEGISKRYLFVVNNYAGFARKHYAANATGTSLSMKNVSRDVIYNLPIPLPPLAEQRRIVAKVDELMALCDQLEASLACAATDRARLLEALLHEALAPAA